MFYFITPAINAGDSCIHKYTANNAAAFNGFNNTTASKNRAMVKNNLPITPRYAAAASWSTCQLPLLLNSLSAKKALAITEIMPPASAEYAVTSPNTGSKTADVINARAACQPIMQNGFD